MGADVSCAAMESNWFCSGGHPGCRGRGIRAAQSDFSGCVMVQFTVGFLSLAKNADARCVGTGRLEARGYEESADSTVQNAVA